MYTEYALFCKYTRLDPNVMQNRENVTVIRYYKQAF